MSGWQPARPLSGFDWCFTRYVRGLLKGSFDGVWIRNRVSIPASGYIAAANHNSWWDGFIPYFMHHEHANGTPFRILMSDGELRRFPYFRFGGAFSIDLSAMRRAYDAIEYAAKEAHRGAAVWIFPDGVLRAPSSTLAFTSGFVHAARIANVPILPVAMRFVFLDRQRPEVFVEYGAPIDAGRRDARDATEFAVEAMLGRIDSDLARDGRARFSRILRGRKGVDDRLALARR